MGTEPPNAEIELKAMVSQLGFGPTAIESEFFVIINL